MHIFSCYRYLRYLDDQLNKMKSSSLKTFYCYSKSIIYFIYKFIKLNFRTVGYMYTVLSAFNYDTLNVLIIHQTQNACLHILKIRINMIKVFWHISMFPLYCTIRPTLKCMVLCSISIVVRHGRCIQRTVTRGLFRNDSVIQLTPRFK